MAGFKYIAGAFTPLREPAYSSKTPQTFKAVAPACEYLMNVCLMTYVKYQGILRHVKNAV